jgi:hypothetical protein
MVIGTLGGKWMKSQGIVVCPRKDPLEQSQFQVCPLDGQADAPFSARNAVQGPSKPKAKACAPSLSFFPCCLLSAVLCIAPLLIYVPHAQGLKPIKHCHSLLTYYCITWHIQ